MRSKNILSIIAFITAFAFSSAFAFLFIDKSPTKDAVESILRQDIRYGQERFWRINSSENLSAKSYFESYAEAVEEYANDSGSLSYSHMPRDFQLKWNAHMRAWRDYSNYLNEVKNSSQSMNEDFYDKQKVYSAEINLTYYDVLRVGRTYGIDVSEYLIQ